VTEIYAVSINKGGVGKTSLATNLAGAITSKLKKKVLIIDMDGQGNTSVAFGLKQPNNLEYTIFDVLLGEKKPQEVAWEANKNLHILPSNRKMDSFEFKILPYVNKKYNQPFHLLQSSVEKFVQNYDYVFIDCPPSMGLVTGNALALANKVIIPFAPEVFGVNGLMNIIEGVKDFKSEYNPELEITGVVGMMADSRTSLHGDLLAQARQFCYQNNIQMFDTVIPKSIRFASSTAYDGKPATLSDNKHPIVKSYFTLLKEIIK
jgi:chromosome partitioning protein